MKTTGKKVLGKKKSKKRTKRAIKRSEELKEKFTFLEELNEFLKIEEQYDKWQEKMELIIESKEEK